MLDKVIAMKIIALIIGFCVLSHESCFADQHLWISASSASAAKSIILRSSTVALFCSKCDDERMVIVKIKTVNVVHKKNDYWSVNIAGDVIMQSARIYAQAEGFSETDKFIGVSRPIEMEVDLAYIYSIHDDRYSVISKSLGLETVINLDSFPVSMVR